MEINKRNRKELKSYFVKNAIPSESNFAEFIDAMLNQKDDGIVKLAGDPLSIEASGDEQSQKKVINFYKNFADTKPDWVISLNPRSDPGKPETARPGFSMSDAEGNSRLFIDKNGNVGVGTNTPGSKFTIGATGGQNVLHLASDFGLRGDNKLNLIKFGNDGDYQILHKASGASGRNTLAMHVQTSDSFGVYSSGWLSLFEVAGGTGDTYIRGSIGAGTAAPKAKLHAVGDLVLGLDVNNKRFIFHSRTNGNGEFLQITHDKSDGNWDWSHGITLKRDGKVGIGTPGPRYALEVSGEVFARDGVIVAGNRNTHINADGAFYRYFSQAYITVDDNLYIKDSGGGIKFHFDTNNGVLRQEGWRSLPLINSWVNYGGVYNTAAYFKDKMGTVHLRGLIKNGTNGHICTLPSGYRTPRRKIYAATTHPNEHARVDVLADGRVFATKYSNGWLSLDGITFRVI